MGVTGLWRLIEPAGKPVPVETLENKVLAVGAFESSMSLPPVRNALPAEKNQQETRMLLFSKQVYNSIDTMLYISIWLHQMVKGYQDAKGAPLPNAHLMGLFQRLCKLLYFRIKPVFVFDGAFPDLKKETIAKRQDSKSRYNSQSEKLKREIALLLGKKTAISALLGKQISPKKNKQVEDSDDLFKLPALPDKNMESESESDDEQDSGASTVDLHTVDLESDKFKNMPLKDKYDLLVELKETRKMNSWGKIHTLPKKSDNFSDFQMQRLLKRRKLQECLEETEKEIGDGGMSLTELESLLNEEGIDTKLDSLPGRRIASNNTTRYLLISSVKQALEDAKKKEKEAIKLQPQQPETSTDQDQISLKQDELEDDLQKAIKMSLECVDEADTSVSKTDDSWTSVLTDSDYSDDEDDYEFQQPDMSSAKAYIMQYSDFTHKAIDHIVTSKQKDKNKSKGPKIHEIIEELNQEKTIIEDNIELTSSDEETVENSVNKVDKTYTNEGPKIHEIIEELNQEKTIIEDNIELTSSDEETVENSVNKVDKTYTNDDSQLIVTEKTCVIDKMENADREKKIENDCLIMNDTQQSIVCIENSNDEIISLETSTEDVEDQGQLLEQPKPKIELESESSDDDFEEVSDIEEKLRKPAIQLTLNMGKEVEDDIFADIFKYDENKPNLLKTSNNLNSPVKSESLPVTDIPKSSVNIELKDNLTKPDDVRQKVVTPIEKSQNKMVIDNNDQSMNKQIEEILTTTNNKIQNKNQDLPSKVSSSDNTTEINEKSNREVITVEKLNSLASEIENEEEDLLQEKGRLDRIGRNITYQMTKEAQELLRVFGIPYIVAPMEAEAQCAFLENAKLTDGTITDDSDIWLFGGKTVYKNFFNQKKHVLQFLSEKIEKSFNLSREQLVLLALLVGSDYTTGVSGVGPVTALEILASFPFNKKKVSNEQPKQAQYQELVTGLLEFKKWVKAGKRTDNVSLKKKLKNVDLSDDFPSIRVVQAYLEPNIERSEEKFTWGELDVTILRDYTKAKFGWSQNKLDEIIKPVLKRMLDRKNQKTVFDYFKRKLEFQSLEDQMSKRVKAAVQKMDPERNVTKVNDESQIKSDKQKTKLKRKVKTNDSHEAGPSKAKKHEDETKNIVQVIKSTVVNDSEKVFDVNVQKSERYQEIIPQREMDKKHLLENKLKAIELFRKTKIDRKTKKTKRKLPVPKEKAELSESDSD